MNPSVLLRSLGLAAALGASFSAHALSLKLVSDGTYDLTGSPVTGYTQSETVAISRIGTLPALSTMSLVGSYSSDLSTATYSSAAGTLTFALTYVQDVSGVGVNTNSGTWTITGGTQAYQGLTGAGTYSINYSYGDPGQQESQTTLVGNVQAVPEPASMLALSVGGAALIRRRKKA